MLKQIGERFLAIEHVTLEVPISNHSGFPR